MGESKCICFSTWKMTDGNCFQFPIVSFFVSVQLQWQFQVFAFEEPI